MRIPLPAVRRWRRPTAYTFAVARAVHGIEPLVAAEILSWGGEVRRVRHREVWFEVTAPGPELLRLRTADDVLLAAAVVDGIGPERACLRRLAAAARDIDVEELVRLRRVVGGAAGPGDAGGGPGAGFEVSATFVGRRPYTRFDIEDTVGEALAGPLGLRYHARRGGRVPPEGAMAWRVTIEDDLAVIAVRAAGRPLHRRPYKLGSIRGTLHPPLAAAMARLALPPDPAPPRHVGTAGHAVPPDAAALRRGEPVTVLDPCCGAGTTLVEAYALAPHARLLGVDLDPAALRAAAANAARARTGPLAGHSPGALRAPEPLAAPPGGGGFRWVRADAGRLPVPDGVADRVLVNPPWGRQVPPAGRLATDGDLLRREVSRVLAADGLVVALLHGSPHEWRGFRVEEALEVSLSGRRPVIAVLGRRVRRPGRASRAPAG